MRPPLLPAPQGVTRGGGFRPRGRRRRRGGRRSGPRSRSRSAAAPLRRSPLPAQRPAGDGRGAALPRSPGASVAEEDKRAAAALLLARRRRPSRTKPQRIEPRPDPREAALALWAWLQAPRACCAGAAFSWRVYCSLVTQHPCQRVPSPQQRTRAPTPAARPTRTPRSCYGRRPPRLGT